MKQPRACYWSTMAGRGRERMPILIQDEFCENCEDPEWTCSDCGKIGNSMSNNTIAPQFGDWVNDKNGVCRKVHSCDAHGLVSFAGMFPNGPNSGRHARRGEYSGIPITAERLEKACGFVHRENLLFDHHRFKDMPHYLNNAVFLFYNQSDIDAGQNTYLAGFATSHFDNYDLVTFRWIQYVHELQQLFRGLGLPDPVINPDELKV